MSLDLSLVGHLLRSQDNRATAHPIFVVQQKRRITGLDPKWGGDVVWINEYESEECGAEESAALEQAWDEGFGEEPDGRTRTSFIDVWEFVTCCFTEQAAANYIKENAHNLNEPRIYVESAHRNQEWIAVRHHLKGLAP
jgi:hypothetical protein